MAEQSHREEMNAAIRAQRERQAVPRSMAAADEPPAAAAPTPAEPLLARLRGRLRKK
jgi:hypothetical protein